MKQAKRNLPAMARKFALPCCLLLAAGQAAAQAYKWTDEHGKVHFSDTPPAERKADKITIRPRVPENPAAAAQSRDWQTQLQESNARRHEEQNQQLADERNRKADEHKCASARYDLDILKRERPIYRTGKDGQKEYMDDKDRPAITKTAQERVDRHCR